MYKLHIIIYDHNMAVPWISSILDFRNEVKDSQIKTVFFFFFKESVNSVEHDMID